MRKGTWKTFFKCQTVVGETFIVEIFVRTPLLLPFGKIQIRFFHLLKRFLFLGKLVEVKYEPILLQVISNL